MLRVEHVSKTYDPPGRLLGLLVRTAQKSPVQALTDIDFEVDSGEIVGVVGPNGAGKSTLIRICTGLLTPSHGQVTLASSRSVGLVLAEERALYWRLTGRDNLRFFARMDGLAPAVARKRTDEMLEMFDLADRDRRVFGYSSGMRVRLSLARALLPDPDLLILDEPTRSLDPVASEELLTILRRLADDGKAIMLATHRLDEVEAICDRVLVIINGQQQAWLPTSELGGTASSLRSMLKAEDAP